MCCRTIPIKINEEDKRENLIIIIKIEKDNEIGI
jgi:hypothetical protein